ncbi:rhodanese-like domain-containing protein [Desulfobaculum bizertense]|uniref:Rhodanese-related sulfurtransferase n=1 Tax=Desulfobaculum bizertense DSM 18034 TaxID=1121442 RepID=A0A1T4W6T0_9BACT|nr:rhodanese-like domain-containing protein [Desulfobaculum bizertense]UIJ39069.1 rhodanese-like domain-containing protein [Desulfobaculum bizertense]SKA72956.1 Rhodanese-related sulfurtransferase [Desulfobaculum bizertense DSM 18034]
MMRVFSPKLTVCYEILFLCALALGLAYIANMHNPKGLSWEQVPLKTTTVVQQNDGLPEAGTVGVVTTEQALDLFTEKGAVFVDARFPEDFSEGHVPDAVNISPGMFSEDAMELLGPAENQTLPLIVYCSSLSCRMSNELAENLLMLGYSNVYVYEQGFEGWIEADGLVEMSR